MITRRCGRRQFLLRPSDACNRIILYLLAVAVGMFGVDLHAACFMSNHLHLVLTDRRAMLPEFMHWLMAFLAKCVNVLLGRWGPVFDQGSYSRVDLADAEAVLDKIAYVLCNPVAANLVERGRQWPGVRLGPWKLGEPIPASRPSLFFSPTGSKPETAVLLISKPPAFAHMNDEAYKTMVAKAVEEKEAELRKQAGGMKLLGKDEVLAQSPLDVPKSEEIHRQLNPQVASRNRWHRVEVLQRNRDWLLAYREALAKYTDGEHDVLFPTGTYWMVRYAGARCALPD